MRRTIIAVAAAVALGMAAMTTGAMARAVVVGPNGLARGVSYIDKKTRGEVQIVRRGSCAAEPEPSSVSTGGCV